MNEETRNLLLRIIDDLRKMGHDEAADHIGSLVGPTQESGGNNPPPKGDGG